MVRDCWLGLRGYVRILERRNESGRSSRVEGAAGYRVCGAFLRRAGHHGSFYHLGNKRRERDTDPARHRQRSAGSQFICGWMEHGSPGSFPSFLDRVFGRHGFLYHEQKAPIHDVAADSFRNRLWRGGLPGDVLGGRAAFTRSQRTFLLDGNRDRDRYAHGLRWNSDRSGDQSLFASKVRRFQNREHAVGGLRPGAISPLTFDSWQFGSWLLAKRLRGAWRWEINQISSSLRLILMNSATSEQSHRVSTQSRSIGRRAPATNIP